MNCTMYIGLEFYLLVQIMFCQALETTLFCFVLLQLRFLTDLTQWLSRRYFYSCIYKPHRSNNDVTKKSYTCLEVWKLRFKQHYCIKFYCKVASGYTLLMEAAFISRRWWRIDRLPTIQYIYNMYYIRNVLFNWFYWK